MKKYIVIIALSLVAAASLEAWRGGRWGGGWGRGWGGWGPGIGFTVPIGGSSPKYIMPTSAGDPYNTFTLNFPKARPFRNSDAYRRWLFSNPNYSQAEKDKWWNTFVNNYNTYQATRPAPAGYISIGGGGYWGGGWGPGWGPGWW